MGQLDKDQTWNQVGNGANKWFFEKLLKAVTWTLDSNHGLITIDSLIVNKSGILDILDPEKKMAQKK